MLYLIIDSNQQVMLETPTSFVLPDVSMSTFPEIACALQNITFNDVAYVINRFSENVDFCFSFHPRMVLTSRNCWRSQTHTSPSRTWILCILSPVPLFFLVVISPVFNDSSDEHFGNGYVAL